MSFSIETSNPSEDTDKDLYSKLHLLDEKEQYKIMALLNCEMRNLACAEMHADDAQQPRKRKYDTEQNDAYSVCKNRNFVQFHEDMCEAEKKREEAQYSSSFNQITKTIIDILNVERDDFKNFMLYSLLNEASFKNLPDEEKGEIFLSAANAGRVDMVKSFFRESKAILNATGKEAIKKAAQNGHLEVVKFLLEKDNSLLDVYEDVESDYSITRAIEHGHLNVVEFLLSQPGYDHFKVYCILRASEYGQLEILNFMIKKYEINNNYGVLNISLMHAAENGHLNVVEYLLEKGADPTAQDKEAIKKAAQNGHLEVVKFLLEKDNSLLDVYEDVESDYSITRAIKHGNLKVVKFLLSQTDDDFFKRDCIFWASEYGQLEILEFAIKEYKIDINSLYHSLFAAAENGHLNVVKFFIDRGANPLAKIFAGANDILIYTAGNGHLNVVEYLLEKGADPTAQKNEAIIKAAGEGHLDVVKILLEKGADPTAQDKEAIKKAEQNGHHEVVKILLQSQKVDASETLKKAFRE